MHGKTCQRHARLAHSTVVICAILGVGRCIACMQGKPCRRPAVPFLAVGLAQGFPQGQRRFAASITHLKLHTTLPFCTCVQR